jgi:hypothetical protein
VRGGGHLFLVIVVNFIVVRLIVFYHICLSSQLFWMFLGGIQVFHRLHAVLCFD